MQGVLQDLRFEARQLLRKPGFTAVAVLTLALGAGANALMFTVVDSVLLRPLPYPDAKQLVSIKTTFPFDRSGSTSSLPDFLDLQKQSRSFSGIAVYKGISSSIRLPDGQAIHAFGAMTSTNLFDVLGIQPTLGRSLSAGEVQPGKPCSVVVSAPFWREHLGGDPRGRWRSVHDFGRLAGRF